MPTTRVNSRANDEHVGPAENSPRPVKFSDSGSMSAAHACADGRCDSPVVGTFAAPAQITMLPPRIVLAAVDFSPGSRSALEFAARLVTHCAAELHVLHAVPAPLVGAAQAAGHDVRAEMLEELHRVLAETAPSLETAARCHVIEGEIANVILDIAERERADVIVIGEKGLSNAEWPALGSTLEDVLRRTTISVIVVPLAWQPPDDGRDDLAGVGPIIAGVDMTCPAIEAAAAAGRLAQPLQTRVLMLHAVPPPQTLAPWQAYATAAASMEFEQSRVDFERVASLIAISNAVRSRGSVSATPKFTPYI